MNEINSLLNKYRSGHYTNEDLNALVEALESSSYDDDIELSMFSHWNKCDSEPIGDELRFKQILEEIHSAINSFESGKKVSWTKKLYIGFSKVAAIIILPLIMITIGVLLHDKSPEIALQKNTITVPLGTTSHFDLPDGTHIWLNSGSRITYPLSFNGLKNRIVELNGEGYFKVKKDKSCPFIVKTNGMDVKVTGTTFNARAYSDEPNVTVALVEGSVQLGKHSENNPFEVSGSLHPMETGEYNKTERGLTTSIKPDLTKYTSWINGITVFDNDPILDVTAKLKKLYNVNVIIMDQELYQYRLTATFVDEPLERALKIISLSSPISYRIIAGKQNSNGMFGQRTLILRKSHNH